MKEGEWLIFPFSYFVGFFAAFFLINLILFFNKNFRRKKINDYLVLFLSFVFLATSLFLKEYEVFFIGSILIIFSLVYLHSVAKQ